MINFFRNIVFSFPVQLFALLIKKHQLLLILWIALFGYVTGYLGTFYGIHNLFLNPEYLGEVNYIGFFIVGFALGGFIMAWHLSFYLVNSHRFNFLATSSRPFIIFCINNGFIPTVFIGFYVVNIAIFQYYQELIPKREIAYNIVSMLSGIAVMALVNFLYFALLNKNVYSFLKGLKDKTREKLASQKIQLNKIRNEYEPEENQWPVETYFTPTLRLKLVRNTEHYDPALIRRVLQQHHRNAFTFIFFAVATIVALGKLMDIPIFRIPAGATMLLFFTIIMVFVSSLNYWFRGWRTVAVIVILLIINFGSMKNYFVYKNKVFGLNYAPKTLVPYNNETIDTSITPKRMQQDIEISKSILKKWRFNNFVKYGESKPLLFFITASGGGTRASIWAMHVLQELEKEFGHTIMDHAISMTGASGGMLGLAYYRELFYREKMGENFDSKEPEYLEDIGKDLLNSMIFTTLSNDLFIPAQKINVDGYTYKKDRAYTFEKHFNENTRFLLDKPYMSYRDAEMNADIPIMVLNPTIVIDQRFLFISAVPMSYLTRPLYKNDVSVFMDDGIDFMTFFKNNGAENLSMTTAIRMNASFPYLFPTAYLPTTPEIKVLDAGIRDNNGMSVPARFINALNDWINTNTSGVVFLELRAGTRGYDLQAHTPSSFITNMAKPIGNIFQNFLIEQEYVNDHLIASLMNNMKVPLYYYDFEYRPSILKREAPISLHVTNREKQDIRDAYYLPENQESLMKLRELLKNIK